MIIQNVRFLTLFLGFYRLKNTQKKFEMNQNISYQLDEGYRLVHELSYLKKKYFRYFFTIRGTLIQKNRNFFSNQGMTIHAPIERPD